MNKLVSVVTSTFRRHDQLIKYNIPSIQKQTYPKIEHIIVVDEYDIELKRKIDKLGKQKYPIRVCLLGRDWRKFGKGKWAEVPRMVDTYLARGSYIAYLDDDDEAYPEHIEKCLALLEKDKVDFVYSKFIRYLKGKYHSTLGVLPLKCGNITASCILHKVELLNISNWFPIQNDEADDWELINKWIQRGATYSFLNEITIKINLNKEGLNKRGIKEIG